MRELTNNPLLLTLLCATLLNTHRSLRAARRAGCKRGWVDVVARPDKSKMNPRVDLVHGVCGCWNAWRGRCGRPRTEGRPPHGDWTYTLTRVREHDASDDECRALREAFDEARLLIKEGTTARSFRRRSWSTLPAPDRCKARRGLPPSVTRAAVNEVATSSSSTWPITVGTKS